MAKKKLVKKKTDVVETEAKDLEETADEQSTDPIVINQSEGLVFSSEEELYNHFSKDIKLLEKHFFSLRKDDDIALDDFSEFEECLPLLLEEPLEVWQDDETFSDFSVMNYIGEFEDEEEASSEPVFYVAQVYLADDVPSFVYLHFPTHDEELVDQYRKGRLVFDESRRGVFLGAAEGDALSEGEELAVGLYKAMLKLRSEKDINESDFHEFVELREGTIEDADEIWQNNDLQGNVLVSFIKEYSDIEVVDHGDEDLYYIVVTSEDSATQTHALLFSFPTVDVNLVDRYRHGENLQAEEVVQQSNH